MDGSALLWGHCHHRATGGVDTEQQVLEQMGLDTESVSGGCCGLAGSWGFEGGKWQISQDCGEQAYLPAVREASQDTVVVANGFSCQTQLEHAPDTDRRALHLGQVMALARSRVGRQSEGMSAPPEHGDLPGKPRPGALRRGVRVGASAALLAGPVGVALAALLRRSRANT